MFGRREEYGEELNFSRFGYTSVLSLACASDKVWSERRATGDWRLLAVAGACAGAGADAGAGAATVAGAGRAPPSPPPTRAPSPPVDPDDALPGIDYVSHFIVNK